MRPSREVFEEMMSEYARHRAWRPSAKAALLGVYDAQEAQIRELADALEAVLDNVPTCVFVDAYPWDGRCGTHDSTVQEPGKCAIQRAVDVLARTRGES